MVYIGKLAGNYITRQRGWHSHKGKGQLPTYWLCGQGDNILPSYTQTEMMEEEAKKQVNQVLEQVRLISKLIVDTAISDRLALKAKRVFLSDCYMSCLNLI